MATERALERCRERIGALTAQPSDQFELRFEIVELLRPVIGFERWCWPICDPESGLGTSAVGEHDYWPALQRLLLLDQRLTEPDALPTLAGASARGGAGLRFRDVLGPTGIGDELRVPLRDPHGLWGCLDLMRSSDEQPFSDEDVRFLESVGSDLAAATRRSAAAGAAGPPSAETVTPSAGVVVVDSDLDVRAATAGARAWIGQLAPRGLPFAGIAAMAIVFNVASRVLAGAQHARVRARTTLGTWAVVEADSLDSAAGTVAVTIRPATAQEVLDLRLLAYDLTTREREIVLALLDGSDTRAVANRLFLSPHTVNDHLKAIFGKVGVRTRKELVAVMARP